MPTTKLNLPLIDGTNTADVVRDMNALANAVDSKAGASDGLATLDASGKVPASQLNVSAPADATTTTKGVVQLSSSTTSTSETLAATPKAVKDAKDGLSTQIGILSGLNTTAKDNLVNAVNELFTFANDGKSKWSSVIGSPLVSTDTFTDMQTKTQTIKNTLATNLTAKGQSSTGTETLTALVNKVANVATGKKFATGAVSRDSTFTNFTTGSGAFQSNQPSVTVSGLSFMPSLVYLIGNAGLDITVANTGNTNVAKIDVVAGRTDSTPAVVTFRLTGNAYINNGGFKLPCAGSASYSYLAIE